MDAEFRTHLHAQLDNGIRYLGKEVPHLKARICMYESYIDRLRAAAKTAIDEYDRLFDLNQEVQASLDFDTAIDALEAVYNGE